MSVTTYNSSVRVANWFEDVQLEEDTLRSFLEKRENGQLLVQKAAKLSAVIDDQLGLSSAPDGLLHIGDRVLVMNPCPKDTSRGCSILAANISEEAASDFDGLTGPTDVTASFKVAPTLRSVFQILSSDGSPEGEPLKYSQAFYLASVNGGLLLHSDRATFSNSAKKTRLNKVDLVSQLSTYCQWKVAPFEPKLRLEMELSPVKANENLILTHCRTNENLCVHPGCSISTIFGRELEVTGTTMLDSHRAERDNNHWMLVVHVPGSDVLPAQPPQ